MTLEVFHFEISGIDSNDSQSENKLGILATLEIFHCEMSDKIVDFTKLNFLLCKLNEN